MNTIDSMIVTLSGKEKRTEELFFEKKSSSVRFSLPDKVTIIESIVFIFTTIQSNTFLWHEKFYLKYLETSDEFVRINSKSILDSRVNYW